MKIIDLTLPIYTGMPVYPGDPGARVERIQSFEKDGWNMSRIQINTHDGTHVNIPIHATRDGKDLDDYTLDDFMGDAVLFESPDDLQEGLGVIFCDTNIDSKIADVIIQKKPKFVGLSDQFEFDVEVERYLLQNGIISFEKLANTDQLPKRFFFHGAPLKILEGDGSPVRAYAIVF